MPETSDRQTRGEFLDATDIRAVRRVTGTAARLRRSPTKFSAAPPLHISDGESPANNSRERSDALRSARGGRHLTLSAPSNVGHRCARAICLFHACQRRCDEDFLSLVRENITPYLNELILCSCVHRICSAASSEIAEIRLEGFSAMARFGTPRPAPAVTRAGRRPAFHAPPPKMPTAHSSD